MGPSRPEAHQYSADQSQYVPPLQSWPPSAPQAQPAPGNVVPQRSVLAPWLFVALGLIIPISALITAVWAGFQARSGDRRYVWIAIVGFVLFVVVFKARYEAATNELNEILRDGGAGSPPAQPRQP